MGAVLASAGRYDEAAAAYGEAVAKEATSENVTRQYEAMIKAGKTHEALAGLTSWVDGHPDDRLARLALANALIMTKRNSEARAQYELLIAKDPDNVVVLNNLAWLYAAEGDPRSIEYAERAYRLDPASPEVADTLGVILTGSSNNDRALKLLSAAHDKIPSSPETTYHLAVALKNAGKADEARTLLAQLLATTVAFDERPKAETLKQQLDAH